MIEKGLALADPRSGRLILQVVPKPGVNAALVVDLVGFLAQSVILAGILDEHHVLFRAAGNVVKLDALVIEDRAVVVANFDEQRSGHGLHAEHSGIANVGLQVFVQRNLHALLAGLDVIGFRDAGAPVMIAVVADEVGDGRPGDGCGKEIRGMRGEKSCVEAAPGMAHDADSLGVDDAHLNHFLHRGSDAIHD